jgi:hypothetical protein
LLADLTGTKKGCDRANAALARSCSTDAACWNADRAAGIGSDPDNGTAIADRHGRT